LDGDINRLKGRTSACDYPAMVSDVPVYADVVPNYDMLSTNKPDLVVLDDSLYSPAIVAKIKSIVGDKNVYEFHSTTIADFENQLRELGAIIGQPINMSKYIDSIESAMQEAKASMPPSTPKIAVLNGTYIAGTKSFVADAVKAAGGQLVGPDSDRFVPMNPEALMQINPDIVIVATQISQRGNEDKANEATLIKAANDFAADPKFKSLRAVQAGQIYPMDAAIVVRQGSRVDSLIRGFSQRIQHWAKR